MRSINLVRHLMVMGLLMAILSGCGTPSSGQASSQTAATSSTTAMQSTTRRLRPTTMPSTTLSRETPGPDAMRVTLTIPEDRSLKAVVRLENLSDTVYSTGYSFQLLVRNDELTWEPLMADIYVPAIGKDLQPGEEMTYELDAQIFESGKTYKAVWRYEPVDDPKHPLYSETEAIMAP